MRSAANALARDLAAAGYTDGGVRASFGDAAVDAISRAIAQPARREAIANPGPLATLVRVLWLGDAVSRHELADALPTAGVATAVDLGIVDVAGERVVPVITVRSCAMRDALGSVDWWIASDLDELSGTRPLREDHVLGVGGAARTLAALVPPVAAGSALDLGTGCGILALHVRRFAAHVVATDVSERALWMARLTLALNGVDDVELRHGSLFEPVADERFDLIASNPPFVITPRAPGVPAYEYRDGGLAGDALIASVVARAGDHLRPGGHARMLGNWESRGACAGLDRALAWSAGSIDTWVIERESLSPERYAELWVRDGGTRPGDPGFDELLDAWIDDMTARDVTAIGMGWVALHRPIDRAVVRRAERIAHAVDLSRVGSHLAESLDAAASLADLDNDAIAELRLRVASDVTEARHQLPGAAGPNVIELRQGGGLARTLSVDTGLAALVGACDGELSVGVLVDAIAGLLDVDGAALLKELLPHVRELVRMGFLSTTHD